MIKMFKKGEIRVKINFATLAVTLPLQASKVMVQKMTVKMLAFLIIILVMIPFSSCSQRKPRSKIISDKRFLGVIETTGQDNKSFLTFYDKALIKQDTLELPFGSMGSYFDLPKVQDHYLYIVPRGIASIKDLSIVLEVDLSAGKYKTYDMKQPQINSFCVDDDYVYSVNTLNHQSIISQYNKTDEVLNTLEIGKIFIGKIDRYQDKLYAFGFGDDGMGSMQSYLYIIDPIQLTIEMEIDLTEEGQDQLGTISIQNNLYFTNALKYNQNRGEIPSTNLSQLDTKQHSITSISLQSTYPFQILEHQEKLYISHYNLVQGKGNQLSVYDPALKITEIHDFQHHLAQISIHDGHIYITDGEKLYTYIIEADTFRKVKEIDIYTKRHENNHYYISGFFVTP